MRSKVIASTATVRLAQKQIQALFNRREVANASDWTPSLAQNTSPVVGSPAPHPGGGEGG